MTKYEFKAVAMPTTARRLSREERGEDAITVTLIETMNALGLEGWDYVRTETLSMKKAGILGSKEETRDVMIFRRELTTFFGVKDEVREETKKITARRVTRPALVDTVRTGARRVTLNDAMSRAAGNPA